MVFNWTIHNIPPYVPAAAFDPVNYVPAASLCKPVHHLPIDRFHSGVYGKARGDFFAVDTAKFRHPSFIHGEGVIQKNNVIQRAFLFNVPKFSYYVCGSPPSQVSPIRIKVPDSACRTEGAGKWAAALGNKVGHSVPFVKEITGQKGYFVKGFQWWPDFRPACTLWPYIGNFAPSDLFALF
jgi:hypothetical protein